MEFRAIERTAGAFQDSLTREQIESICLRVFDAEAVAAVELGLGTYNSTYRVEMKGHDRPIVVRAAPTPTRQFRSERELMRNEYATAPWITSLAKFTPRILAADWTHEIIERDYLVQTFLQGRPAPEHLNNYPRESWISYFRQLGTLTAQIHSIRGPHYGWINGVRHERWSEAIVASLRDIAIDVETIGLEASDLRTAAEVAERHQKVLDEVREPRLLAGDLWHVNVMLDPVAPVPTINGILDLDRTWWGDPMADWTIRMAAAKPGTERDTFWETYGQVDHSANAEIRRMIYELRHLAAIRLERYRLNNVEGVQASYKETAAVLARLA